MALTYDILIGAKTVSGSIASWVNNSAFPATTVLDEAQAWLYEEQLRVREMLTVTDAVMTVGTGGATIALPDDFVAAAWLGYRGQWTGTIEPLPAADLQKKRTFDSANSYALAPGQPFFYTLRGTVIELPQAPDQAYTYRLAYYARTADLSASNQTNWLTRKAPRLLRQTCCAFAYEFMKAADEKVYWLGLAQESIASLNAVTDAEMGGMIADMVVA